MEAEHTRSGCFVPPAVFRQVKHRWVLCLIILTGFPTGNVALHAQQEAPYSWLCFDAGYAKDEVRLGFLPQFNLGKYHVAGPGMYATTSIRDPYNEGKIAPSIFGLVTLAGTLLAQPFYRADMSGRDTLMAILMLSPFFLANSEHHLVLFEPESAASPAGTTLSVFASTRTDWFYPLGGGYKWSRFSPGLGLSLELMTMSADDPPTVEFHGFKIECGVEYPMDLVANPPKSRVRVFVSVRSLSPAFRQGLHALLGFW